MQKEYMVIYDIPVFKYMHLGDNEFDYIEVDNKIPYDDIDKYYTEHNGRFITIEEYAEIEFINYKIVFEKEEKQ